MLRLARRPDAATSVSGDSIGMSTELPPSLPDFVRRGDSGISAIEMPDHRIGVPLGQDRDRDGGSAEGRLSIASADDFFRGEGIVQRHHAAAMPAPPQREVRSVTEMQRSGQAQASSAHTSRTGSSNLSSTAGPDMDAGNATDVTDHSKMQGDELSQGNIGRRSTSSSSSSRLSAVLPSSMVQDETAGHGASRRLGSSASRFAEHAMRLGGVSNASGLQPSLARQIASSASAAASRLSSGLGLPS